MVEVGKIDTTLISDPESSRPESRIGEHGHTPWSDTSYQRNGIQIKRPPGKSTGHYVSKDNERRMNEPYWMGITRENCTHLAIQENNVSCYRPQNFCILFWLAMPRTKKFKASSTVILLK